MVGLGLSQEDIWNALEEVKDPEIPILSIIDLKIVRSVEIRDDAVTVQITPTFVGCPALDMIAGAIQDVLIAKGIKTVNVRKDFALQWSTDMLDSEVREKLRLFGIAPPSPTGNVEIELPTVCPYCSSPRTQLENSFGATLCKQIYYCNSCLQSFEKFKSL